MITTARPTPSTTSTASTASHWARTSHWTLHVGYNDLDEDGGFLSDGQDSYVDYSVGLTTSVASVDLTLAVVGTDLDEDEVFGTEWGDDSVIFTISKSM